LKIDPPLPDAFVKGDRVLLQNVIINILENSVKYKAGEIGEVTVSGRADDGGIRICLADNGIGVSQDALGKLFDVFYRADPSRGEIGNGLGLAISAKIIGRMGGNISAEPVSGGGLAIVIDLPLAYEAEGKLRVLECSTG
jgi:signal transduction histidine kinase